MTPQPVNLDCYHGDTWTQTFRLLQDNVPVDLTNATIAAWAKNGAGHTVLTVSKGAPGEITLSIPAGGITVGKYDYDVEVTLAGQVTTWVKGSLTVIQDITNG